MLLFLDYYKVCTSITTTRTPAHASPRVDVLYSTLMRRRSFRVCNQMVQATIVLRITCSSIRTCFHMFVLGHSQCKTLSQSLRQLIKYYLWYFAEVATYLLKKEVEKIRL